MIVVYRPELESPPMDKECTISFTFVDGGGLPECIQIPAGVTRDFPEDVWEKIKNYDVVKGLLKLGALRVQDEVPEETIPAPVANADTIADLPLAEALNLVEASFDVAQLRRWDARESRIRVKNTIARRITAITEGKA